MGGLFESLTGCALQDPGFLWLLPALLLLPLLRARLGRDAFAFAPAPLAGLGEALLPPAPPLPRSWRARLAFVPAALAGVGLATLVVALARPLRPVAVPEELPGIDVLLVVDLSSSMAQRDLDPQRSRLQVAVATAREFVAARPDDRIGLLSFARYPDLRCPCTLDHEALAAVLGAVATVSPSSPEDATGIGTAVARAAQLLQAAPGRARVVVLLTDGKENVAAPGAADELDPAAAGRLCREFGVRVHAIATGQGDPGPDGNLVPIDTTEVRELAAATGGRFFAAGSAAALAQVWADIDALERTAVAPPRLLLEDACAPFLVVGLLVLAMGRLLAATALRVTP